MLRNGQTDKPPKAGEDGDLNATVGTDRMSPLQLGSRRSVTPGHGTVTHAVLTEDAAPPDPDSGSDR